MRANSIADSKIETPCFRESFRVLDVILFLTGVVGILVIFQDRPMFSHIIQRVSARAFH